jgi:hypothetical protein
VTTVIINDFVTDRRTAILFNHPQDFVQVNAFWEKEEKLLVQLAENESFRDRKRLCDLSPTHFRFLIMATLKKVADLAPEQHSDPAHPAMTTLTFLLTGFIKCLEDRTESSLELMRINRLGEDEILYDYAGSINMHLDSLRPKKGLRVIVDNT